MVLLAAFQSRKKLLSAFLITVAFLLLIYHLMTPKSILYNPLSTSSQTKFKFPVNSGTRLFTSNLNQKETNNNLNVIPLDLIGGSVYNSSNHLNSSNETVMSANITSSSKSLENSFHLLKQSPLGVSEDQSNSSNRLRFYGNNTGGKLPITSDNDHSTTTTMCSQQKRKTYLHNQCQRKPAKNETKGAVRFIIDDKHKVVYCSTPKIACSTMKIIMVNISTNGSLKANLGQVDIRNIHAKVDSSKYKNHSLRLQKYYTSDLDSYSKLLIVRHPITRLVSAYKDKMLGYDTTYNNYAFKLTQQYRAGVNQSARLYPTFKEFVRMMLDGKMALSHNEHFIPYFHSCNPCHIKYDYVLKVETLHNELDKVLSQIYGKQYQKFATDLELNKIPENETFVNANDNREKSQKYDSYVKYFETIKTEDTLKLMKKYENEFHYYGYSFDTDLIAKCSCKDSSLSPACC